VRNLIDADLQAFTNNGGFRIHANRIDGNLQCKSNNPPPRGGQNLVQGNKEDQCRRL
jgi:CRISPR/Cas system CMR-associated protein Cmr1 (group 7 of RAMP superfamily)